MRTMRSGLWYFDYFNLPHSHFQVEYRLIMWENISFSVGKNNSVNWFSNDLRIAVEDFLGLPIDLIVLYNLAVQKQLHSKVLSLLLRDMQHTDYCLTSDIAGI